MLTNKAVKIKMRHLPGISFGDLFGMVGCDPSKTSPKKRCLLISQGGEGVTWRIVEPTSMAIPRRHPQMIQEFLKIWLGGLVGYGMFQGFFLENHYIILTPSKIERVPMPMGSRKSNGMSRIELIRFPLAPKFMPIQPCLTWMSHEVSKRLGSVGYNPNYNPHL